MKRILAALIGLTALIVSPGAAEANGRFPESNQLFFSPKDPNHLFLRTTFGFLDSKDRGLTWAWICEETFPLSGSEDPMVAITPSGTILATTFQGLSISKNAACDWTFAGGELDKKVFIDLTANPNDPKHVAVFASSYDHQDDAGALFFDSRIWETQDEGQTFTVLGPSLEPSLLAYTLDLTKSDPDRIYATAVREPGANTRAFLLASKDHGKTWTETEVPLVDTERALFIAAVDPLDADRLYLRSSNGSDRPSRLLFSKDGGATWATIYQAQGPLLGFALSGDGSKVYVGGPNDGIRVASTTDFVFQQKSSIEVQCLALATDGLWACSNEKSGFIIALSKDEGATFERETHFCDIKGPLECPAGTTTNTACPGRWPGQKALLGCGADVTPGGDGGAGPDGGGGAPIDDLIEPGGGCDCRASRTSPLTAFASASLAIAAVVTVFRRARRR